MYKIIEDNQSDFFLEPIPKWITHFGFGLTVLIFLALLLFISQLNYPQTISLPISIKTDQVVAKTDFETFTTLQQDQEIKIKIPFSQEPLLGTINKKEAWAKGTNIFLPITLASKDIEAIPFEDELICQGEILINNQTLLEKIIKK